MKELTSKVGGRTMKPLFVSPDTHRKVMDLREKSGMMAYRIVEDAVNLFEAEHNLGGN